MKQPAKAAKKPASLDEIELHPDAWDRFERFVKAKVPNRAAPKAAAPLRKAPKKA